ncbi:MAG: hypothetical protein WDW38_006502 [Sanguina aurantia]
MAADGCTAVGVMAAIDPSTSPIQAVFDGRCALRMEHGEPRVIDRLRDTVRMAAGLRADGTLDAERRARALNCLARFGQRIAGLPSLRVRAVATNTRQPLRHPIEVVFDSADQSPDLASRRGAATAALARAHAAVRIGFASNHPRRGHRRSAGGGVHALIMARDLARAAARGRQAGCIASTSAPRARAAARRRAQRARLRARSEIGVLLQQFDEDYRAVSPASQDARVGVARAASIGAIGIGDDAIFRRR